MPGGLARRTIPHGPEGKSAAARAANAVNAATNAIHTAFPCPP
jgi:hypothetical protein